MCDLPSVASAYQAIMLSGRHACHETPLASVEHPLTTVLFLFGRSMDWGAIPFLVQDELALWGRSTWESPNIRGPKNRFYYIMIFMILPHRDSQHGASNFGNPQVQGLLLLPQGPKGQETMVCYAVIRHGVGCYIYMHISICSVYVYIYIYTYKYT